MAHAIGLDQLASVLRQAAIERVLIVTTPGKRFVEHVTLALGDCSHEIFDGARVHVPTQVVAQAQEVVARFKPQAIVSVGGGAATGLGKAIQLHGSYCFVAIPTTYAGSEMTSMWGTTDGQRKTTGRDPRVRPDRVVHEPRFFATMPASLSVRSAMNAVAHPISALSTGELEDEEEAQALAAVEQLFAPIDKFSRMGDNKASHQDRQRALTGCALAGEVIDRGTLGPHHKGAHLLGGRFGLDHSSLHAALLPQTLASLPDPLWSKVGEATGSSNPAGELHDCLTRVAAHASLDALGVSHTQLEDLLAGADFSEDLANLLRLAHAGERPQR